MRNLEAMSKIGFRQFCNNTAVKPFRSIPGPKALPLVGNIWRYFPIIGEFNLNRMHINAEMMRKKYGDVVREVVFGDRVVVHVFDPEDMEKILRQEGRYPERLSHRALLKYRKERPDLYNTGGLFPTNGPDWHRLRGLVQKPLLQPGTQDIYVSALQDIAEEFAIKISSETTNDLQDDLYKWALECTGLLALDIRLGCLATKLDPCSEAQQLIDSAAATHHSVMVTENGLPFWKYFKTKAYRELTTAQDCMAQIIDKYLNLPRKDASTDKKSVLQRFLTTPGLEKSDIFTMILDMFLAGIDTTAYATGFTLYHLSQNKDVQIKLKEELKLILPRKDAKITASVIRDSSYIKACVKESLRLHPIAIGIGRLLPDDIVLKGYLIPKNTMLVLHNQVACQQESNFKNPKQFVPERWLKGDPLEEKPHPFLLLPFGYGPRMCVGRRFAELEMYILLIKLFRNFSVSYEGEPLDCYTRLINVPDQPLKFNFS